MEEKIGAGAVSSENYKPAVESDGNKPPTATIAANNEPEEKKHKRDEFLFDQYKVLSDRRISHDKMTWEIPALAAQSFLIGLSFQADNNLIKIITAFIALFSGILLIQYFERNRIMEVSDSVQLNHIENYFLSHGYHCMIVHHKLEYKTDLYNHKIIKELEKKDTNFFNRTSSYAFWKSGMYTLTIVSFVIFLYCIFSQFALIKEFIENFNIQAKILLISVPLLNWIQLAYFYIARSRSVAESQGNAKTKSDAETKCKEIEQKYEKAFGFVLALEIAAVLSVMLILGLISNAQLIISIQNIIISVGIGAVFIIVIYGFQLYNRKKEKERKA